MMNFIGLLFLSGINIRTSERDYWSVDPYIRCNVFAQCMTRNRFMEIKGCLHAADNQNLCDSRMAKVKPLYDLLNQKLNMFGVFHEDLSIDESMVPYYGRHNCKQFIRSKPIRFGFKIWALASSTGLPYKVDIYEGKAKVEGSDEPLGTRVVKNALTICDQPEFHSVYFDNFFTSYKLLVDLHEQGFRATGTMRNDRTMECPLTAVDAMKKTERGTFDYRSSKNIEIVRWNDNSVVTIGSNALGVNPVGQVRRWLKGKGKTNVEQPAVVGAYNRGMGGVDLMDRALSDFRPAIHGKKWYWPLVVNALNIAFVYSWRLHGIVTTELIRQKDYRLKVISVLLKKSTASRAARSRPSITYM